MFQKTRVTNLEKKSKPPIKIDVTIGEWSEAEEAEIRRKNPDEDYIFVRPKSMHNH